MSESKPGQTTTQQTKDSHQKQPQNNPWKQSSEENNKKDKEGKGKQEKSISQRFSLNRIEAANTTSRIADTSKTVSRISVSGFATTVSDCCGSLN